VIAGKSATIHNLLLDNNFYKKGAEAKISIFYTKAADDFSEARLKGTKINETFLVLNIENSEGVVCGKEIKTILNDDLIEHKVEYPVEIDCFSPTIKARVLEKETGEVLAISEFTFSSENFLSNGDSLNQEKEKTEKETLISLIIFISGLVLIVVLITLIFVSKKRSSISMLVFTFVTLGAFFFINQTQAATQIRWVRYSVKHPYTSNNQWIKHDLLMYYNLYRNTYNPGETATAEIWLTEMSCSNSWASAHLQIQIPAGASNAVYQNGSGHFLTYRRVPTTPGNYQAIFHFADLRQWIPGYSFSGNPNPVFSVPFTVKAPPCAVSSWSPATSTVCSGTKFTQTSNCNTTRTAWGTKDCTPTCTASCGSWSSWSSCSATYCGTTGTKTRSRTCTRSDCSTYTDTDSTSCSGTVGVCSSSSSYCSGVKYSDSCGTVNACTGTKTCSGTQCTTPSYSCSASNFWVKNSSLQARLCSGYPAACPWVTIGTAGCYDDEDCGTATCKNPCTYKLCSSDEKEVLERTKGTTETCTASAVGCGTTPNPQCNPDTVFETCETGYVCKPVSGTTCGETNVDCVPKSSSWSEV
jgi:hypothetical protein